MKNFSIQCDWIDIDLEDDLEISKTYAKIKIKIGNCFVTRNQCWFEKEERDEINVSAYPLALWFAFSWWRLCYEENRRREHSWNESHYLNASGYGFIWPKVIFTLTNNEIKCQAGKTKKNDTLQFLLSEECCVSCLSFKREVNSFIRKVIKRLNDNGTKNSDLHEIWKDVCKERKNSEYSRYRILEAQLGYDPDENKEDPRLLECLNKKS